MCRFLFFLTILSSLLAPMILTVGKSVNRVTEKERTGHLAVDGAWLEHCSGQVSHFIKQTNKHCVVYE